MISKILIGAAVLTALVLITEAICVLIQMIYWKLDKDERNFIDYARKTFCPFEEEQSFTDWIFYSLSVGITGLIGVSLLLGLCLLIGGLII